MYFISSYLRHSCRPNSKVCYLSNNNTLSLISTQYIKKGEEITISYIDTHNKTLKQCHEELYNKFKIKVIIIIIIYKYKYKNNFIFIFIRKFYILIYIFYINSLFIIYICIYLHLNSFKMN